MKNSAFTYRDHMLAQETLTFPLKNIQMEVDGLCLFEEKKDADPASAIMSFELGQPGELPVAYFGSAARIGPVGSGVPLVNSQVRLTGFKLDTLGSLVPSATSASLGATGFDASMALALDGERVKLNASVLSDKNIKYRGITVHGPLNAPEVELGILDGIYGRVSDGLINFGQNGLHAGVGIAEGGVDAVKEVGSGAIGVAKNIGKNLLKAGAGLFSFDQEKVKDGLVGSTKGSADITLDSVKGAGSAAEGRLRGSVSELKGENAVKEWNKGIPARFITSMKQAEERLAKMPYPPVTK